MNQSLCLLAGVAATVLASIYATAVGQPAAASPLAHTPAAPLKPVANRPPLATTPFLPLPIGSVKAEGWLLRQLQLQKAGLTGSAEQLYDALTPDSGWLGGKGENWEKGPYYVRGLIALAWTLDDAELKQRSQKWVDWALQSQRADGFFGPSQNDDWWPRMVVLWYLRDYYEATQDPRVIPFFTKYFRHQLANLPGRPLRDWGRSRAGDNIDIVLWTYNQTGDAALLDLAKVLYDQAYPWQSIFTLGRYNDFGEDFQPKHIVNVSQALKFPAVAWQFTHSDADFDAYFAGVNNLDKRYGRLDGQVSGTEMLSGRASTDGVELCADIERIMSDGIAVTTFGDPAIGDRLERVAFNSLPAHTSPRMQQITYYQLMNQVTATPGGHGFQQDYGNGNMPGPHSGFPCCCYNWHAGWPKYVQQMWAATNDGGLVAIAYGPNQLKTLVAGNVPVTVTQTTDYPFAETITLKVEPANATKFPLVLRIPGWCDAAEIAVNGERASDPMKRTFVRLDREWKPGDVVTLKFPMKVRASTWVNNSVGLERGPLTFALKIKEDWKKKTELMNDFDEYEVHPQSAWNYALDLNEADISKIKVTTAAVPEVPFSTENPAVTLTIPAKKLPEWGLRPQPAARVVFGRADRNWTQLAEADAINTSAAAASATANDKTDKSHTVRIETRGPRLRVYVDDMTRPVLTQRDATFPVGGIGLRAYEAAATFKNIRLNGQPVSNAKDAFQFLGGEWTSANGELKTTPARDAKAFYTPANNLRDLTFEATVSIEAPNGGGGNAGLLIHSTPLGQELDGYKGYYIGLSAGRKLSQDAAEPPTSPVKTTEPTEQVELIPFGSGKLRVTYFPVTK